MPKDTPPEIVAHLGDEMRRAILSLENKYKLEDFGLKVAPTDDTSLAAFIARLTKFWHALVKERKFEAE